MILFVIEISMDKYIVIQCHHCSKLIVKPKSLLNQPYRHCVWRGDGKDVGIDITEEECNELISKGLVFGCGKIISLT